MNLHGKSLIAGVPGEPGGATFHALNPATGEVLAPAFHEASLAEVNRAMEAAAEAFVTFRTSIGADRANLLDAIANEIEGIGDLLLQRTTAETGLPAARIAGESVRTCNQLRLFAHLLREGSWVDARIDTELPDRQPLPRPDLRRMLIPIGPVVVFGSSNFPLAFSVAGGDTASALAAGCTVVVKAHRAHPGTSELVAGAIQRALQACDFPAGVFSLVHGGGSTLGIAMVKHPAAAAVGFTGSHAAGRALFDAAASRPHPIPVFAEMSSINPTFIFPGAMRQRGAAIANGLAASFTLGVGQFCTKPGLVFVLGGEETNAFLPLFAEAVRKAPCGTMLTPGIRDAFVQNRGKVTGVPGVQPFASATAVADNAKTQAQPAASITAAREFLAHPELATEAFGPFTLLIQCANLDEMVACASALEGQLTATLHGTPGDFREAKPLLPVLERRVGRLIFNGFPTGVEVSPAMNHGGPYPATTDVRFTSVGTAAIQRFVRPICYQGMSQELLPPALQNTNPLRLVRILNGLSSREPI